MHACAKYMKVKRCLHACILVMIMTYIAVVLKLSDHKSQLSECQMYLIVSHTNLPVR